MSRTVTERTERAARGCVTAIAFGLAALATLFALFLWLYTLGSTAPCVAYDQTLLRTHRVIDSITVAVIVIVWIAGIALMRRNRGWRRALYALVVPASIIATLTIAQSILAVAPDVLDVSDDASSACV